MVATAISRNKHGKAGGSPKTGGVRTVHVTFKVLDALAEFNEPARITDLAIKLGMTLPRVSRHVSTLRSLGLIDKVEPREAYVLGAKLFTLGQAALQQNSLASVAHPHISRLRDQTHRSVLLATAAPGGAVVLMCMDSGEAATIVVRPGTLLTFPQSPTARLFFAFSANSSNSAAASPSTTALLDYSETDRKQLTAKVSQILESFYDYSPDARSTGIGSLACPIFNHEDRIVGAVSLVMATQTLGSQPESEMLIAVKTCATRISQALGSKTWERARS